MLELKQKPPCLALISISKTEHQCILPDYVFCFFPLKLGQDTRPPSEFLGVWLLPASCHTRCNSQHYNGLQLLPALGPLFLFILSLGCSFSHFPVESMTSSSVTLCGDSDSITSVAWLSYCSWPELSYPNCSYYAQLFPKPVLFNFGFVCLCLLQLRWNLYGIKSFQVCISYTLLYSWCYTAITSIQFQGICALEKTQLHSATTPDNSPSFLASSTDLPILDIFMQMALHDLWFPYSLISLAYCSPGSSI